MIKTKSASAELRVTHITGDDMAVFDLSQPAFMLWLEQGVNDTPFAAHERGEGWLWFLLEDEAQDTIDIIQEFLNDED